MKRHGSLRGKYFLGRNYTNTRSLYRWSLQSSLWKKKKVTFSHGNYGNIVRLTISYLTYHNLLNFLIYTQINIINYYFRYLNKYSNYFFFLTCYFSYYIASNFYSWKRIIIIIRFSPPRIRRLWAGLYFHDTRSKVNTDWRCATWYATQ